MTVDRVSPGVRRSTSVFCFLWSRWMEPRWRTRNLHRDPEGRSLRDVDLAIAMHLALQHTVLSEALSS